MSTLLFGFERAPISADEAEVRSTTNVIDHDAPSATMEDAPDFNEFESDPDTEGGLTTHQVSSHVVPSVKSVSPVLGQATAEHNDIVNRTISSVGTAAAREAVGEWGHGTLMVTEGIEPTVRGDAAFGNEYFAAGKPDIQEGMSNAMNPAVAADPKTLAESQATGNRNARQAASPYTQFLANEIGGRNV